MSRQYPRHTVARAADGSLQAIHADRTPAINRFTPEVRYVAMEIPNAPQRLTRREAVTNLLEHLGLERILETDDRAELRAALANP